MANITLVGLHLEYQTHAYQWSHVENWWTWESKCSSAIAKWPLIPHYSHICIEPWFSMLMWQMTYQ